MPEFKSEIRESQIMRLIERVQNKNYGKYLYKTVLVKVRGLKDCVVTFDFPVTAIIGPNGGGKSTILGSAACAYKSVKPGRFFAKSGLFDDSMQNWKIRYEVIDKTLNRKDMVHRSASFKQYRWTRDALDREVQIFGISRTVPANEKPEYRKCSSATFRVESDRIETLCENVANAVGKILGKDVSTYNRIRVDERGNVSLLTGTTEQAVQYSEFHFGAGESSVIKMVMALESLPVNSLVLIEEIENGLHPVATIRMVEYLIDLAERKRIQTIFTTHSNDGLKPLPSKAIWAALGNQVVQGKLNIDSLRTITGQIEAQLVVYTEDEFATAWLKAMIRSSETLDLEMVEVHPMAGDGTAVAMNRYHNMDPSGRMSSLCFIDGDSSQKESEGEQIYRLPGEVPETYIYDSVMDNLDELSGLLAVALHLPYQKEEHVAKVVREVRRTNRDPHLLFSQLGQRLGFIPERTVRDAFLYAWIQHYPSEVEQLMKPLETFVGKRNGS